MVVSTCIRVTPATPVCSEYDNLTAKLGRKQLEAWLGSAGSWYDELETHQSVQNTVKCGCFLTSDLKIEQT